MKLLFASANLLQRTGIQLMLQATLMLPNTFSGFNIPVCSNGGNCELFYSYRTELANKASSFHMLTHSWVWWLKGDRHIIFVEMMYLVRQASWQLSWEYSYRQLFFYIIYLHLREAKALEVSASMMVYVKYFVECPVESRLSSLRWWRLRSLLDPSNLYSWTVHSWKYDFLQFFWTQWIVAHLPVLWLCYNCVSTVLFCLKYVIMNC